MSAPGANSPGLNTPGLNSPGVGAPGANTSGLDTTAANGSSPERSWPLWEVFVRGKRGLSHVHVGSLHAPDAEMAGSKRLYCQFDIHQSETSVLCPGPPRCKLARI